MKLTLAIGCALVVLTACQGQSPLAASTTHAAAASGPAAFASPTATPKFVAEAYLRLAPEAVRITSSSLIAANRFPLVDATVTDNARSRQLLQIVAQLQPVTALRSCPIDFGLVYSIEWRQAGRPIALGVVHAGGCRDIQLDGTAPLATTTEFWNALATLVNVPEPQLHPSPLP